MRPRQPSRRQRQRRAIVILVALVVVVLVVVGLIVVPPIVARASAVARYDAATGQVHALRARLDDAFASAAGGAPGASLEQLDAVLAIDSPLVTADAVDALRAAVDAAEATLGADQSAILFRPAIDTRTATIAQLDAESAALEAGLAGLRSTVEAAPETVSAAADALATAWGDFRTAVAAQGTVVLGAWSDAEKPTEDALATSLAAFAAAPVDQADAALGDATAKAKAVIADAQAYRDTLTSDASGTSSQPTGGDVDAQLDYLLAHWNTYNVAEWGDYNAYGGDCVNFTSQGLIARGWKMDEEWNSPGADGFASKAWISTTAMEAYLTSQGFVSHDDDHLDRVRVGDVGIFDWGEVAPGVDHTMTVSKVEYTPEGPTVYFVSHNADGDYRELQYTLFEQHQNSKVRIYSIP